MALRVHFLDVGQGDSTLVELPNRQVMLVDVCLNDARVMKYVMAHLRRPGGGEKPVLDYLVITHPHDDHIGGIGKLASKVRILNVWESGHRLFVPAELKPQYKNYYDMLDLFQRVKKQGGTVRKLRASSAPLRLSDDVVAYCLSPARTYAESDHPSKNEIHVQCLVLKLVHGQGSIMFTGDSNLASWRDRIVPHYGRRGSDLLRSRILHASHHGSLSFFSDGNDDKPYIGALDEVSPALTVVSVGKNSYGHPDALALQLYSECSTVKRTDHHGSFTLVLGKDGSLREEHEDQEQTPGPDWFSIVATVALALLAWVGLEKVNEWLRQRRQG